MWDTFVLCDEQIDLMCASIVPASVFLDYQPGADRFQQSTGKNAPAVDEGREESYRHSEGIIENSESVGRLFACVFVSLCLERWDLN